MKIKRTVSYRKLTQAMCVAWLAWTGQQALAQQPAAQQPVEEVTVTGTRLVTSGVNTPTPVTAVSGVDLQTMEPGTLVDSLKQLPQFYNNLTTQQAVGGAVAPGGSNVNLRGLGAPRTLALLDGHRIGPSNKFGTVDVGVIPETLIRSVEAVTGGASAAYGADAVAGVVNFRLDRAFTGVKYAIQGGSTTYKDDNGYKLSFAYGTDVGSKGHIITSMENFHKDGINSFKSLQARSDYLNNKSLVTNPDPNGPTWLARPNVITTNYTPGGILADAFPFARPRDINGNVVALPASLDHLEFLPDGSGRTQLLVPPPGAVGRLSGGCNCLSLPTLDYGVNSDTQVDEPSDRYSFFTHYDYQVNDRNSFYLETLLADTQASLRWQSVPLLAPWVTVVFQDNPYLPANVKQAMQNANIWSIPFGIFTPNPDGSPFSGAKLIAKNRYGQFTSGFTHDMSDDFLAGGWSLDGYIQYAQNRQETNVPGGIRTDRLFLAMDAVTGPDGTPICRVTDPQYTPDPSLLSDCVPINLFGGTAAVTPAAAGYVVDNGKIARGRTTEDDVEITFRGNVTKGSGGALGPITAAFGLSWREEQLYVYTVDPCDEFPCTTNDVPLTDLLLPNGVSLNPTGSRGIIAGVNLDGTVNPDGIPGLRYVPGGFRGDSNSSTVLFSSQRTTEGAYNVREGFFEFGIPLLKDGKLNLDEAYRRANYTGSGGVDAWKSGVSYQATPKFRIRATRSQDVRAPTLQERFESQRGGVNVNDPANGNAPTTTASYQGGNPNVGLETALTDTIGIVYQPLDKLSLTIDSYDINLDGAIGLLGFQSIVNDCWDSAGHNSSPLCAFVHRTGDPITGDINRVDNLYINLSNERVKGVDLELNLNGINVGRGMLSWRFLASRLDENSVQPPGGVRDERAGDVGTLGLPKNKVTTSLRWSQGPVALFLQERYIGGGLMNHLYTQSSVAIPGVTTVDNNQVDSVLYTDLTFTYSGKSGSMPWETFLTVNNLANTAPPDLYPGLGRAGVPGPNSFVYDTIGRRWTAGIRVNF